MPFWSVRRNVGNRTHDRWTNLGNDEFANRGEPNIFEIFAAIAGQ
jgi:hypothetical protein